MKYSTAAVSAMLLAASAYAAPADTKAARRAARMARRAQRTHIGPISAQTLEPVVINSPNEVSYSENWAGAIIVGTDITSVTAEFTIPSASGSSGAGGSAWVGIDGDTCDTAILQTGVDWVIENDKATYEAWYEWYPLSSDDFDLTVAEGDVIKATVTATSTTAGSAVLENVTTGKSVTKTFTNEGSTGKLCLVNAEWIVEDFEEGDSLVAFAEFSTVTFTDASYVTDGTTTGVTDASVIDIEQDNKVLTSCAVESSSEITCSYE